MEIYKESTGITKGLDVGNVGKSIQECLLGFGSCNWVDGDAMYCDWGN